MRSDTPQDEARRAYNIVTGWFIGIGVLVFAVLWYAASHAERPRTPEERFMEQ